MHRLGRGGRHGCTLSRTVVYPSFAWPKGLDGQTDGILVVSLIQGVLDRGLGLLSKAYLPWKGKRFDAASNRGDNLLTGFARYPAKLIWPRYETEAVPGGRAAFDFETRIEPGKHDPDTRVLVIDYAPVETDGAQQAAARIAELL